MKIQNGVRFYVITVLLICSGLGRCAADAVGANMSTSLRTNDEQVDPACPAYDNKDCPYTRIKRGRDWIAGGMKDQDGGIGNLGTVVGTLENDGVSSCFVIWDGYEGLQYSYPVGVGMGSYLCTTEADDHDLNAFVDGFDIEAFIESIYYWWPEETINQTKNSTNEQNTVTLLQLETLCIMLIVWTTVYNL